LGSSAVKEMSSGRQIAPILWATCSFSSPANSCVARVPSLTVTNAAIAWPLDLVRPPDHRRLRDGRMVHQGGLDLHGRDVVAGDQHDVVHAAEQPEVALVVALGAVARRSRSAR
jgi:hypothetical protein